MRALSGAAAAQLLRLDGFRDGEWPGVWCSNRNSRSQRGVIRSRTWYPPQTIDGISVAHAAVVLRHIAIQPLGHPQLSDHDLVELAVEHALRDGLVTLGDLKTQGAQGRGELILRQVLMRRPKDEPPTESYAETRAVQVFRELGVTPWRQMPIYERGRQKHRVDFVIPFRRTRVRPSIVAPPDGLLVEIDSREWHEGSFEKDHERQSTYDRLGFHWITLTPNQVEHSSIKRTIDGAIRRATGSPLETRRQPMRPRSPTR
jgi:hypothetical protein